MKLVFVALTLIFCSSIETHKFDHVRKYLAEHDKSIKTKLKRDASNWLQNSNTIGLGYNPLYGSPVCYTGACQGDGFRRSIFKLKYSQPMIGSCTSQLIPESVELHCIPSVNLQTTTETISTLKQLSDSTSKGISFGGGLKYKVLSAAYSYSKEISSMIDRITKDDRTILFTRGEVTMGKLSMLEPFMELSDAFQYVISEIPCCDNNSLEIEEYIEKYIIEDFGLTYVSELMLGGIAQEIISISNTEMRRMQSKGDDVAHSANIEFFVELNLKPKFWYNQTKQDQFLKSVKDRKSLRLGGNPSVKVIDDWIQTVPQNPVIMNYVVKDIVGLLTTKRFPNDNLILNKSKLVEKTIQQYLDKQKASCFNNCTDSNHGQCNLSSIDPFLLGTCKCLLGWKGYDCSTKNVFIIDIDTTSSAPTTRERKSYVKKGNVKAANGRTTRLLSFSCPLPEQTDVTQISIASTQFDSFHVQTGDGCDPNGPLTRIPADMIYLSTQKTVNSFSWSHFKRLKNGLCVEIYCDNILMSCDVNYAIVVNCE